MNRRVEIVDDLRANRRLREHEIDRCRRVVRVAIEHGEERAVAIGRLEILGVDDDGVLRAKPAQRRRSPREESRSCPPDWLAASPGSPCTAYASMNS